MDFKNPQASADLQNRIQNCNNQMKNVITNIEKVIKGKKSVIEEVLIALTSNGHVLLRDVPGVGKTVLAKTVAKSIHANFRRIQFTPDLLPSDITGVNIYNQKTQEFEFQAGPVFTNILLADEINRSSPKTQSALLEAMEERQVTVDNVQYNLGKPFFVIATKNPIEHAGTYPLPAAQLDRFIMQLSIGYPDKETELEILSEKTGNKNELADLEPVVTGDDILTWQTTSNDIYTSPVLDNYIINLVRETREGTMQGLGISTRAAIQLKKAAKSCAMINSRDFVTPDDIHRVIKPVFGHRLGSNGKVGDAIVEEVLQKVVL